MKNIYLFGHTGSINRGCEAIVVSTSYILDLIGVDKTHRFLLTYNKKYDEFLNLDKTINLISYPKKNLFNKGISYICNKINFVGLRNKSNVCYFRKFLEMSNKDSIAFAIGGDTYCYKDPVMTYASNLFLKENNIPNVFFGCSISTATKEKKYMCEDINNYSYIITRESYSKKIFEEILHNKNKLFYACDPAFHLPIKKIQVPKNFKDKNTVGINVSPLVFKNVDDKEDIMYKNIKNLIDYIVNETDMNVCLIPHVYNIEKNLQDSYVLNIIYNDYKDCNRVSIVNTELSCTELKYIISRCRFFVGARTHATIAAYSTNVPTLVLSYSIKSRGIAKDLFGTEDGYLLKWNEIKNKDEIKNMFINSLLKNEKQIINKYKKVLPDYKKTIIDSMKKILEDFDYKNEK